MRWLAAAAMVAVVSLLAFTAQGGARGRGPVRDVPHVAARATRLPPRLPPQPAADSTCVARRAVAGAGAAQLLGALRGEPFAERADIVAELLALHRGDPTVPMLDILAVPLPVRAYGAVALACRPGMDPAIAARLADLLATAPADAHPALIRGLGRSRAAVHECAIIATLADAPPGSDLRQACYLALGDLQTPGAAIELLRGFDADPGARSTLVRAWGSVRDPEALRAARAQWDGLGPMGRTALLQAGAGRLGTLALRALDDPTPEVRVAAASAVRSREQAPALLARLERESEPRVRRALLDALRVAGTRETAQASLAYVSELPQARRPEYERAFQRQLSMPAQQAPSRKPP